MAHRLRRPVPAHDVRRQADARPRAHAGDRAREPRLPGQAGRPRRRLPRPRRRAEAGAGHLHRERRRRGTAGSIRPRPSRVMLEKYEVCCGIFHGFDWSPGSSGTAAERLLAPPSRPGARPGAGGRQGAPAARGDRALEGVRARRARRRGARDPRRRGVLPGGARGAREESARRAEDR